MIKLLSYRIAHWLERHNAISCEEEPLYRYAAFNVLYAAIPILIMLVIGMVLHVISGTILFIATFVALRKYSGGFHVQSFRTCLCFSILVEFIFIHLASYIDYAIILIPLIMISSVSLIRFSPIQSASRPLSIDDIVFCKRRIKIILVFLLFFCYLLCITDLESFAAYPVSATAMVAVFQYPALIHHRWR
ncbi:MAG: accessory gene regulator B family protein [Eubacterium sp.]|nr:accessory gene regulator B family protein [Eubacterium sp.]